MTPSVRVWEALVPSCICTGIWVHITSQNIIEFHILKTIHIYDDPAILLLGVCTKSSVWTGKDECVRVFSTPLYITVKIRKCLKYTGSLLSKLWCRIQYHGMSKGS